MKPKQTQLVSKVSPKSTFKDTNGCLTSPSPFKRSPIRTEKTPCTSRGNSTSLRTPMSIQTDIPLHSEIKKHVPYIFDPETVESLTTENNNNSPLPVVKPDDNDFESRLRLGELKLSRLDNRITECLENSRRVLSMTEIDGTTTSRNIISPKNFMAAANAYSSKSSGRNREEEYNSQEAKMEAKAREEALPDEKIIRPYKNKNKNTLEKSVRDKLHLARSKSCSLITQDLALDLIRDKIEIFAQNGFLSTKNKGEDQDLGLKKKDFNFKNLLDTISPSMQKIRLLMPLEYDKLEEKIGSLQTIGLFSPKEMDIHSIASIKEEMGKGAEQDLRKSLRNNFLATNTSGEYKTIEELRDFISLLQNLDAKTAFQSDNSNLSFFDVKDVGNRQTVEHKASNYNNNILEIEEVHLEDKETRPSFENKKQIHTNTDQQKAHQPQRKIEPSAIAKTRHSSVTAKQRIVNRIREKGIDPTMELRTRFESEQLSSKREVQPETNPPQRAVKIDTKAPTQNSRVALKSQEAGGSNYSSVDRRKNSVRRSSDAAQVPQTARERVKVFERASGDSKEKEVQVPQSVRERVKVVERANDSKEREKEKEVRAPHSVRERVKVAERASGDSKEREKDSIEVNRKKPSEPPLSREASTEGNLTSRRKQTETMQNLVTKFLRDAERRKESLERARAAKEEEEKLKAEAFMNHVFTNKNNKAESKVRQYIRRSRDRIDFTNGSETQRIEKSGVTQDKATKKVSFSIEKSPNRLNLQDTTGAVEQKRIKAISKNHLEKDIKEIKTICSKGDLELDLDYLKGLRGDIEKIKENIEEKIQGIERANTNRGSSSNSLTKGILKSPNNVISKGSKSTNTSIERINEKSQKSRVKTRFQNSGSRILEYMSNKSEKVTEPEQKRLPNQTSIESLNQLTSFSSSTKNSRTKGYITPQKWNTNERVQTTRPGFMDDVKAMSYVNQLIMDFKDVQSLKSPRKK